MNPLIYIRTAAFEDLNAILSLFQTTIQHSCQKAQIAVWTNSAENEDRWRKAIEEQFFIVAEKENEILGFASLENNNYIDFLYVHKDHQRKGIATLLLDILRKKAKQKEQLTLWSHVSKTACPFFEQNGFEVIRENSKEVKGVEIMNYWMKKS